MGNYLEVKTHYPMFSHEPGNQGIWIHKRSYANAGQFHKNFVVDYFKRCVKDWHIKLEYRPDGLYQVWLGCDK